MARRRNVVVALAAAALVAAGAGVAWYARPRMRPPVAPAPAREPDRSVLSDIAVYLMPVAADARPPGDGEAVWDGLWPGIAADAESRALLGRLYGGAPAALVAGPDAGASGPAPGAGLAVVLRVDARRVEDRFSTRRGHVAGRIDLHRESTAQFHPARFHAPAGTPPEDVLGKAFAAAMDAQPDDLDILLLVANDYLLRHRPGWQLASHGFSADAVAVPTGGPAALRSDLDRRISDYLGRHAVGADLGGPKP
jgi:hypothetical protein